MENEFKTILAEFSDGKATFHSIVQISDNIFHDKETGYLHCYNSILGGTGIQKYLGKEIGLKDENADKVIEMVRESVDVFNLDSMSTFKGKPVTLFHPESKVNSKNFKKFIVGSLTDAKQDENNKEHLIGDHVIYDEYTVDKVLKGELKDLSLGYRAKVVPTGDGRYKQTDIVINHLAIVEDGRAEMAQIMDNNTVKDEKETILEPQDFTDKIHVTERVEIVESTDTYDDETNESTYQKNVKTVEKHSHYEKMKQILMDSKTNKKGETKMEKDFKYFIAEVKELSAYPESDFRDAAYKALKDECMEKLGVELISFADTKQSAIAKSVGLVDSKVIEEEVEETKVLEVYAKDENRFYEKLYRSMDNTDTARKYAGMTFHDVLTTIQEGKVL